MNHNVFTASSTEKALNNLNPQNLRFDIEKANVISPPVIEISLEDPKIPYSKKTRNRLAKKYGKNPFSIKFVQRKLVHIDTIDKTKQLGRQVRLDQEKIIQIQNFMESIGIDPSSAPIKVRKKNHSEWANPYEYVLIDGLHRSNVFSILNVNYILVDIYEGSHIALEQESLHANCEHLPALAASRNDIIKTFLSQVEEGILDNSIEDAKAFCAVHMKRFTKSVIEKTIQTMTHKTHVSIGTNKQLIDLATEGLAGYKPSDFAAKYNAPWGGAKNHIIEPNKTIGYVQDGSRAKEAFTDGYDKIIRSYPDANILVTQYLGHNAVNAVQAGKCTVQEYREKQDLEFDQRLNSRAELYFNIFMKSIKNYNGKNGDKLLDIFDSIDKIEFKKQIKESMPVKAGGWIPQLTDPKSNRMLEGENGETVDAKGNPFWNKNNSHYKPKHKKLPNVLPFDSSNLSEYLNVEDDIDD